MSILPIRAPRATSTACDPDVCMIDGTLCDYCARSAQERTQRTQDTEDTGRRTQDAEDSPPQGECAPVSVSVSGVPDYLRAIWDASRTMPPPAVADRYYLPGVRALIGLCAALQAAAGDGRTFFLACRHGGELIGADYRRVSAWLRRLESDGVLSRVATGSKATRRANEYRYIGRKQNER